jgi:hypothetical protein
MCCCSWKLVDAIPTPSVAAALGVWGTVNWREGPSFVYGVSSVSNGGRLLLFIAFPSDKQYGGGDDRLAGRYGWQRAFYYLIGYSAATSLYANGYYGVFDVVLRLIDVRFGHLFRNLAGVSKF